MTSEITVNIPAANRKSRSIVRFVPVTLRILLGLPLLIFGLNGFLNFIPEPQMQIPQAALNFLTALVNTGYMTHLIAATHLIVGILLLTNRFVPLALALLAPFTVNSVAFHSLLEHSGLPMALTFLVLQLALVWFYRDAYRGMLKARTEPSVK